MADEERHIEKKPLIWKSGLGKFQNEGITSSQVQGQEWVCCPQKNEKSSNVTERSDPGEDL